MKDVLISVLKVVGLYKSFRIPRSISHNFRPIPTLHDANIMKTVVDANIRNLKDDEKAVAAFISDINVRLATFRNRHIPFLSHFAPLRNKSILEIGCCSGSSTIALAEQGAIVTGIDVDADEILVAKQRLHDFGLTGQSFHNMNAIDIAGHFAPQSFDIIIYFASLEHMTYSERQQTLKAAWTILKEGGLLCVFGTPNRLWHFDGHTSLLPFFLWLPDDLAFEYSRFSPRKEFNTLHQSSFEEKETEFFRWGRGFSYHEIELALQPIAAFRQVEDMAGFLRRYSFIQKISYKRSDEYRYKKILHDKAKHIHPGFFEQMLDIILVK